MQDLYHKLYEQHVWCRSLKRLTVFLLGLDLGMELWPPFRV